MSRPSSLGQRLRSLRRQTGRGLKQVAPDLGITYTYLSKVESDSVVPSSEVLDRIAQYYGQDLAALLLAAGRIPPEFLKAIQSDPDQAVRLLRERFAVAKSTT